MQSGDAQPGNILGVQNYAKSDRIYSGDPNTLIFGNVYFSSDLKSLPSEQFRDQ